MNNKKSITNNMEKELELGKYLESDMIALTDDEISGGVTPVISGAISGFVGGFVSDNTCPTGVCTRAC